ncbi:UNVERIFIED_CONTAM: hypothetical protein GTU68_052457 [Idotea baltica]|nr:hypothetical protein [Idotea baltica]
MLSAKLSVSALLFCALFACTSSQASEETSSTESTSVDTAHLERAVFAGGCFWCMEGPFEKLKGVGAVLSGYSGGKKETANYKLVSAGSTKHAEVIEVLYDPKLVSYEKLLETFWHNIDPLAKDSQFCDSGTQYRSAIFFKDAEEQKQAEASKQKLEQNSKFSGKIATQIVSLDAFYPAEEYHQDYYKKNPIRYGMYRKGCGRDARLEELWGKSGH